MRRCVAICIAALALASCGATFDSAQYVRASSDVKARSAASSEYIKHVVVVIQENRSFDDFFATFPGADGTSGGYMKNPSGSGDTYVPLHKANLAGQCDWGHSYHIVPVDYDGGKMDGFGLESGDNCPGKVGTRVYQYVDPKQIAPYWTMASQYVLADHLFQTQGSGSFTAHQDLIAGATIINAPKDTVSLVDFPSHAPWGCDAPPGTKTSLLVAMQSGLKHEYHKGPFPCLTYATLRDLLDAKSVTWKYYSPPEPHGSGSLWNAFDAIEAVRKGPQWQTNIARSQDFFKDVSAGTLPSVAWIVPDNTNSDHPGSGSDTGPSWVASIVNAVGESKYWPNTAIVIVWDDWGGFYDNVPPPFFDQWGGLGFRVPMIVVSAYAREAHSGKPGYISHTHYEFGSILKFIERVWSLGSLGTTDKRATGIGDCFDFTQPPRAFTPIAAKYSKSYFLHQRPSYRPVDSE